MRLPTKEVFPLIKDNKMWLGATGNGKDFVFAVPEGAKVAPQDKRLKGWGMVIIQDWSNACWYSSIEHGRRHSQPLQLMTIMDNLKYGSKED